MSKKLIYRKRFDTKTEPYDINEEYEQAIDETDVEESIFISIPKIKRKIITDTFISVAKVFSEQHNLDIDIFERSNNIEACFYADYMLFLGDKKEIFESILLYADACTITINTDEYSSNKIAFHLFCFTHDLKYKG